MTEDNESSKQQMVFSLDIPQREGTPGFIGTHFTLMLQMGNIVSKMDNHTDFRLQYMVNLLISLVPDKKERAAIRKEMKDSIEARTKGLATKEDKGRETQLVCLETVGSVMDFIDRHIGVSKENKIGFAVAKKEKT